MLKQTDIVVPGAHPPWIVQRPKVIFNAHSNLFVMYFHLDQPKHNNCNVITLLDKPNHTTCHVLGGRIWAILYGARTPQEKLQEPNKEHTKTQQETQRNLTRNTTKPTREQRCTNKDIDTTRK